MKKTQFTCLTLAAALLASSCTSSYQAAGGVTGAMIGSHVGGAVGVLSGHGPFRGESAALGSLIGMGIGAILGVGITSQIEEREKAEAHRHEEYGTTNNDEYYGNNADYQTSGGYQDGSYQGATENRNYQIGRNSHNGDVTTSVLSISELTYMDSDGDGYISKDETIEVEGFITNTSNTLLRDVVIYLDVNDSKNFGISPSLTTTLQAGQKIRYTGRVHCRKARGNASINIRLNTVYREKTYSSNSLFVNVK